MPYRQPHEYIPRPRPRPGRSRAVAVALGIALAAALIAVAILAMVLLTRNPSANPRIYPWGGCQIRVQRLPPD